MMILKQHTPYIRLYLVADGIPPLAKLLLQRERRLAIARTCDYHNEFSALQFTAGTKFMNDLEQNLNKKTIPEIVDKYDCDVTCLISGPNESELKIFNTIASVSKHNPTHNHYIVSNDADLILMALSQPNYRDIKIICRNFKQNYVCDPGLFITSLFDGQIKPKYPNLDISFVSMMLGNDYLPHIDYITTSNIWAAYFNALAIYPDGCVQRNNINMQFIRKMLTYLLVNIKPHYAKKFTLLDYDEQCYANYVDGLLWCYNMYAKTICHKFDYQCIATKIHIRGLLLYLDNHDVIKCDNTTMITLLDNHIYSLLVIPYRASELLNHTYPNHIMKRIQFIYDEENCKTCNKHYNEINRLTELHKFAIEWDENPEQYKQPIDDVKRAMMLHKPTHKRLNINDINKVIDIIENN